MKTNHIFRHITVTLFVLLSLSTVFLILSPFYATSYFPPLQIWFSPDSMPMNAIILITLMMGILSVLLYRQDIKLTSKNLDDVNRYLSPLMKNGIQAFHPFSVPFSESKVSLSTELKIALNEILSHIKTQDSTTQKRKDLLTQFNVLLASHALSLKGYLELCSLCLANLGYGIRVLNQEGDILFENQMFHQLSSPFGRSFSSTIALALRNISTIKAENIYTLKRRLNTIQIQVTDLQLPEQNQMTGSLVVIEDITAQETLRTQLIEKERWSAIGELSAQISHEIRNPLNAIIMTTDLLEDDLKAIPDLPESTLKHFQGISKQAERLLMFSDQYLKLHRMFEPAGPFDPFLVLEDALSALKPLAEKNHVRIESRINVTRNSQKTFPLNGDPQALYTIVQNVILNALDEMKTGTIHLQVQLLHHKIFVLRIKDEGPGIDINKRDAIFSPFFTTKKEGTGLGLALVKRATQHLQGTCHVICGQSNRGTLFRFQFPTTSRGLSHAENTPSL
jgi:signal transduction histidine kinase